MSEPTPSGAHVTAITTIAPRTPYRSSPCSTTGSAASPRTASSRRTSPSSIACGSTSTPSATRRVAGRDVLEVSCGRGGGANFVSRTFKPQRYVGVDLERRRTSGSRRARAARAGSHVRDRQRRAARSARCLVRRRHQHRGLAPLRRSRPVLRRGAARAQTRRLSSATRTAAGPTTTAREDLHRPPASSCSSGSRSRATCCTRCARTTRAARRCSTR